MSIPGNYQPYAPRIDFGWIGQGWRLFTEQTGTWVGAVALLALVYALITAIIAVPSGLWAYILYIYHFVIAASAGHTSPQIDARALLLRILPYSLIMSVVVSILYGGLYRMALKQIRGEEIRATHLFSAFDVALPLAVMGLVFSAVSEGLALALPSVGSLGRFVSFILQGLFLMAPFVIVDRRVGPIQALTESLAILRGQRWIAIFFYFVLGLLDFVGALPCGLGMLATLPLLCLALGFGYLVLTQQIPPVTGGYPQASYGQAEPGVWPPPPNI